MFKVKIASALVILFAAVISPLVAWGAGSTHTHITLTATVDSFAEFEVHLNAITAADWTGHITAVGQSRTSKVPESTFKLFTNVDVTITPTATANSGILTNGTQTLTTEYKLTGTGFLPQDAVYKAAGSAGGEFFDAANTYALTHVAGTGSYNVILNARATSAAASAPDSGDYTCEVTLTAAW